MKKLILIAVVVFGFAATSFAQTTANAGIAGSVVAPTSINAGLKIGWNSDLKFGKITNGTAAFSYIHVTAAGQRSVDDNTTNNGTPGNTVNNGATVTGTPTAAQFLIEGAMGAISTLGITIPNLEFQVGGSSKITIEPYLSSDHNLASNGNDVYTTIAPYGTNNGKYLLKIGGTFKLASTDNGDYNLSGLTVTVNMP